jgi:transposase
MKASGNFLSAADRADLVKIAKDGLEENRVCRRATAILLLDRGWSFAEIAEALFIDDSTVRIWLKEFQEGGVEALVLFDLKGGTSRLSPLQLDELRAWATQTLPTSATEVGRFVKERFGLDYGRSGLFKLMNRIGFDWKKPEAAPGGSTWKPSASSSPRTRAGRGGRPCRRRPSDPSNPVRRTLAAARPALRDRHVVRARSAEPARRDRPGNGRDQDRRGRKGRRPKHHPPARIHRTGLSDHNEDSRPARQRAVSPRQAGEGMACPARQKDRPALHSALLSAPHPELVEGSIRSNGYGW